MSTIHGLTGCNRGFLMAIEQWRHSINRDVFDYQQLIDALSHYRKPRDKITRMLADGSIIRIKKGLYCSGEVNRRGIISREYLSNLIYGPSYVSLEYALNYHGLIPERVETVTSITTGRTQFFDTPLGRFSYKHRVVFRYFPGAIIETSGTTNFLIASPEKALVDVVWSDRRFKGRSVSGFAAYLTDDLRIEMEMLRNLDLVRFHKIAESYNSQKIYNLIRYLETFMGVHHA